MDGLYWETWYNTRNLTEEEKGYIYYENKMLGVPRIRQVSISWRNHLLCFSVLLLRQAIMYEIP